MKKCGLCHVLALPFLGCLLCGGEARPAATVFPLQYRVEEALGHADSHVGAARFQFHSHAAEDLTAEPVYFSRAPKYLSMRFGFGQDRIFTAVLDESCGTGSGYDTLVVDANNNEDLTDDAVLDGTPDKISGKMTFPVVALSVPYGDAVYPCHIRSSLSDGLYVKTVGYCAGDVLWQGKTYKVGIFDDNGNGLFDEPHKILKERGYRQPLAVTGDAMALLDSGSVLAPSAIYHVKTPLPLGGQCLAVTVAQHGRKLTLGRSFGPSGLLDFKMASGSLLLTGFHGMIQKRGPGIMPVFAGSYSIRSFTYQQRDRQGLAWHVNDRGQLDKKTITVAPGGRTVVPYGFPLTAEIFVTRKLSDEFRFDLKITGLGDIVFSGQDIKPLDQTERPPAPGFNIVAKGKKAGDDRIVASGRFKYG